MPATLIAALYKFTPLSDLEGLKTSLLELCLKHEVTGTLLIAQEGINGTIAGPPTGIRSVLSHLAEDPRIGPFESKESWADTPPFHRIRVRLKREIVSMGVPTVDPLRQVGTYVNPQDWNALISDPDVVVIDTRNTYEIGIGSFPGAISPNTTSFREFPQWVAQSSELADKPRVAMFCTGGIRCEKASSFLLDQGFGEVFHLKGGILNYFKEVDTESSLWEGECFVFDDRVSVDQALNPGHYDLCHGCRRPVDADDMASPLYLAGVSCPSCHDNLTEEQRLRFAERAKQMKLAAEKGERHLGRVHQDRASSAPVPSTD